MLKQILFRYSMVLIACLAYSRLARAEINAFYTLGSGGKLVADEPDFNKEITQVVQKIDELKLAEVKVNIVIQPVGDGASFDYGSVIYIPRSLVFYGQYGGEYQKYSSDIMAVLAHEYGHAVFGKFLEKEFPTYLQLRNLKEEMSGMGLRALKENLTAEQAQELKLDIREREQAISKNEALLKIARQVAPYSELYADVVAVYVENDRSVIYGALSYDNMPFHAADYVQARDFYRQHNADTWTATDEHTMFSPLRSAIGSDVCWPITSQQRQTKLKQLEAILIEQIRAKVSTGQMPVPADNKELIEKFVKTCK